MEQAAKTIKELNYELETQQEFYEKELAAQREQIKKMIDPTPQDTSVTNENLTDQDNYELAVKNVLELRKKLGETTIEREDLMKQISLLTDELKI